MKLAFLLFLLKFDLCLAQGVCNEKFEIKSEHLNKRLVPYTFIEKIVRNRHDCIRECFNFGGECKAVNFNMKNQTCEFKYKGSGDVVDASDFEQAPGYIFTDLTHWPRTFFGGCAYHDCLENQRCYPLGNEAYKCIDKADCGLPQAIEHGLVSSPITTDGAVVTYSCVYGYEIAAATRTMICTEGTWTGKAIVCTLKDCGLPPDLFNGAVNVPVTTHGGSATYTCNFGYYVSSGDALIMCDDGAWTGVPPSCALKVCGPLASILHGTLYAPSTTHGATATYTCDFEYQINSGDSVRTCYGGSWLGTIPTCGPIPHVGCYYVGMSQLYSGTKTHTSGGLLCQRWDSQNPHSHNYTNQSLYPYGTVSENENYCRDPDSTASPWCYTTDPSVRWTFCGVPEC